MKKKIFVSIIAVLLVTCVTATFSIWLGNVNQTKDFTINSTKDFLFISSQDLTVGANTTLAPGKPVVNSFNLKIRGKAVNLKLACDKVEFSKDGGKTYAVADPLQVAVTFVRASIPVAESLTTDIIEPCTATLELLKTEDLVDPIYSNAKFRFTVKVEIVKA